MTESGVPTFVSRSSSALGCPREAPLAQLLGSSWRESSSSTQVLTAKYLQNKRTRPTEQCQFIVVG